MKVGDLLGTATALLDHPVEDTTTVWPLGAAVLIRQSIESTLAFFWKLKGVGMTDVPFTEQWLALPSYIGAAPEADAADYAWHALSQACHHRDYDVGLTQEELRAHLAAARAFAKLVVTKLEGAAR